MEERFYGFYRCKIVLNKDPEKRGRCLIWIPDIMPEIPDDKGLWARPANNPIGGRNEEEDKENYYAGTSYIPKVGAWHWCFFENGNPNRPYYWNALDIENTTVLPENKVGSNYEDKWTLFKSHEGRAIVISDDESDSRVEITGKKRQISNSPSGDEGSVYTIDGNQTTILLDERSGKEKILIKTYKGDYLHIDVDEQMLQMYFKNDIKIQTDGSFHIQAAKDIHIAADENIYQSSGMSSNRTSGLSIYDYAEGGCVNIRSGSDINQEADASVNILSGDDLNVESGADYNLKASGDIKTDGTNRLDQMGSAGSADTADNATEAEPEWPTGGRDD